MRMSSGRVLVTGASGFVGTHLTEQLLASGYEVFGLQRGAGIDLKEGVIPLVADLEDSASLTAIPKSWDLVIHLAGASIPSLFHTTAPAVKNLQQSMNLLEHLDEGRVLLVSSCHVYAPSGELRHETSPIKPQGRYGLSKFLIESLAAHYEGRLDILVARPFNHLGPQQRPELVIPSLIRRLASLDPADHGPVLMQGMNSVRDFIDVRDVVGAYMAILHLEKPPFKCFNVCTGTGHSIEDLAHALMNLLGIRREVQFAGGPNSQDDNSYLVGSPQRLADLCSWRPSYTLTQTLGHVLNALQP